MILSIINYLLRPELPDPEPLEELEELLLEELLLPLEELPERPLELVPEEELPLLGRLTLLELELELGRLELDEELLTELEPELGRLTLPELELELGRLELDEELVLELELGRTVPEEELPLLPLGRTVAPVVPPLEVPLLPFGATGVAPLVLMLPGVLDP